MLMQGCHKLAATLQGCNKIAARLLQPRNFHMGYYTSSGKISSAALFNILGPTMCGVFDVLLAS